MTGASLLERLGGRLRWVREHQRIRGATRSALAASEADRRRIALLLNALRLEIRRRQWDGAAHPPPAGAGPPPAEAGGNESRGGEQC